MCCTCRRVRQMRGDHGLATKFFHHILRESTHRPLLSCILRRILTGFGCYALTKRPLIQSLSVRHLLPLCQEICVDARVPSQLGPVSFYPNCPPEFCTHLMVLGSNLRILCVFAVILSIRSFHAACCFVYVADDWATRDRRIFVAGFFLQVLLCRHCLCSFWDWHPDLNFHVFLLMLFLFE